MSDANWTPIQPDGGYYLMTESGQWLLTEDDQIIYTEANLWGPIDDSQSPG